MKEITKRQHYVPRFHLNYFSTSGTIWVYDKENRKEFQTNIKDAAIENYFYCDETMQEIEKALSKIEGESSIIYKKIVEEETIKNLTNQERFSFSRWILLQHVRTKAYREEVKEYLSKVSEKCGIKENLDEVPFQLSLMFPNYKEKDERGINIDVEMVKTIYSMHWCILVSKSIYGYCTSDAPIIRENRYFKKNVTEDNIYVCFKCRYSFLKPGFCPSCGKETIHIDPTRLVIFKSGKYANLGYACRGLEMQYPLTPKLCLTLTNPLYEDMDDLQRKMMGDKRYSYTPDVEWTNSHLFVDSYRFMFSKDSFRREGSLDGLIAL